MEKRRTGFGMEVSLSQFSGYILNMKVKMTSFRITIIPNYCRNSWKHSRQLSVNVVNRLLSIVCECKYIHTYINWTTVHTHTHTSKLKLNHSYPQFCMVYSALNSFHKHINAYLPPSRAGQLACGLEFCTGCQFRVVFCFERVAKQWKKNRWYSVWCVAQKVQSISFLAFYGKLADPWCSSWLCMVDSIHQDFHVAKTNS